MSRISSTVLASAARTETGQSTQFDVGEGDTIALLVDVTAVSGTSPSLTVNVEWTDDGSTWFVSDPADAFTAITAADKKAKVFTVKGTAARLNYTISGTTPSLTFSVRAVRQTNR